MTSEPEARLDDKIRRLHCLARGRGRRSAQHLEVAQQRTEGAVVVKELERGLHELLLGLRAHEGAALLRQHGAREPLARAAAAALQQRAQRVVHARGQPLGRVRRDLGVGVGVGVGVGLGVGLGLGVGPTCERDAHCA